MPSGRLSAAALLAALRGVSAALPGAAATGRASGAPFLARGATLPRSFSRRLATAAAAFSVATAFKVGLAGFSAGRFLWTVWGFCLRVMYWRRKGGSTLCAAPGRAAQGGEGKARNFI